MTTAQLDTAAATGDVLRAIGGPSAGAGRLLKALLNEGLDHAALVPAALLAVEFDEQAQRSVGERSLGEDFVGERFGRLTVIAPGGRERNRSYWNVRCDCGTEKKVRADSLTGRNTRSCGCLRLELFALHRRHGRSEAMAGASPVC